MAGEVREVLFNDGEGLVFSDLNDAQRYERAQLWDLAVGERARKGSSSETSVGTTSTFCYSFQGACPLTNGSVRQISNLPGTIMHNPSGADPDGADAKFLSYYLAAGELLTTTAIGDATNPRIDLICIKLAQVSNDAADNQTRDFKDAATLAVSSQTEVKRRKVVLTISVVVGTPAASPAEPAVTAGFVKWAAVTVPALHNAVHDPANVRDYRMPAGLNVYTQHVNGPGPGVHPNPLTGGWVSAVDGSMTSTANGNLLYAFPPSTALVNGRLLAISIIGDLSGCTIEMVRRYNDHQSAASHVVLATLTASFNGGLQQLYQHTFATTEGWWLNGWRAGVATQNAPGAVPNDGRMTTLGLRITASAASKVVRLIKWHVAEV